MLAVEELRGIVEAVVFEPGSWLAPSAGGRKSPEQVRPLMPHERVQHAVVLSTFICVLAEADQTCSCFCSDSSRNDTLGFIAGSG